MNKRYILRKNKDIEKLLSYKKSVGNVYYAIYYQNNLENLKVVASVSKKIGDAVERNYQKRVVKEIIRKNIDMNLKISCLIIVKKKSLDLSFLEKENNLIYLFNKIIKQGEKNVEKK